MEKKWGVFIFHRAKSHFIPVGLRGVIISDMEKRRCTLSRSLEVDSCSVCLGGARLASDMVMEFPLLGTVFKFYASDLDHYYEALRHAELRESLGEPYYKLHGDLHVLCLTPSDKEELENAISKKLPEANAIRAVETEQWRKVMSELREHPNIDFGLPVEKHPNQ